MKTGTEFNLAQIIESLSANASVSRVIPGNSADAGQFSRILDTAMEIAARDESGMPSSAISESGSIVPLSTDKAALDAVQQAEIVASSSTEQPLQLATVNFLSGRTILITPVDVAEPVAPRMMVDSVVRDLPQWWQEERSPHPAQSLSGVMALAHGKPASNQRGPDLYEWDGGFDIHSANVQEPGNSAVVATPADSDLDEAITSLMAWQQLKQPPAALPRGPDTVVIAAATRVPRTASPISYLDARRNSELSPSAKLLAAAEETLPATAFVGSKAAAAPVLSEGFTPNIPTETTGPVVDSSPAAEVVSALQPQYQPTQIQQSQSVRPALVPTEVGELQRLSPQVIAVASTQVPVPMPAVAMTTDRPVSQAVSLAIPAVAPQPQPQPQRQKFDNAYTPADLMPLGGATKDPVPIEAAVQSGTPANDYEDLVQQRSSQPPTANMAESSQSQGQRAGNGEPRGQNDASGNSRSDTQLILEPRRESDHPAAASTPAVSASPLQVKAQVRFSSGEAPDAGVAAPIRDASQNLQTLQTLVETAAATGRPQPARPELRQEFADTLLGFAAEQLDIPEQGAVTRLRLEVSPPELGNLEIEVTQGPDLLDVRIFASDEAAAATLRESEHVMRELLSRNDSSRITIGIDVSARDSGHGRRREQGSEPDSAPGKSTSRLVKIRLNHDNNFDIYV